MTRNTSKGDKDGERNEPGTLKTIGPQVSDHDLLRCIGSGSYGEVWLARSVMGTYRAAKVVYRKTFEDDRPFEREFFGIQKFEPISRTHPGLVSILHIGKNFESGYFYYLMEIADDAISGQKIHPDNYVPKTLSRELSERGKLPLKECLAVGISLTAALQHLHNHGLIHRDIKPSNIIFVNGVPKFADIGLVTEIGEKATFVGTPGYIAPEGPGNPAADVYSLGKLLYEISMGKDRQQFPDLPTDLDNETDLGQMMRLNELLLKACEPNPHNRFPSAEKMHAALSEIAATVHQSGRSTLAKTSPDVISGIELSHPDVERHLAGSPIAARAPTALYRLGKLIRRNQRAVAVGTATLMLVGLILTVLLLRGPGSRVLAVPPPKSLPANLQALGAGPVLSLIYTGAPPIASAGTPAPQFQFQIQARRQGATDFSNLQDGDTLTSRVDDYLLVARALSEGYLYVFQVDALGKKQWLFPKNENFQFSSGANPVKPTQSLQIPSTAKKAFFLDDNTGIEHIYVVFSAYRWPELEAALSRPLPSAPVGTAVAAVEVPNGLQSRGVGGTHDNAAPAKMDSLPAPETVHGHTYQEWGAGGQRFEATGRFLVIERWFRHVNHTDEK